MANNFFFETNKGYGQKNEGKCQTTTLSGRRDLCGQRNGEGFGSSKVS